MKLFILGQLRVYLGQLDVFSQLPDQVSEKTSMLIEPCSKEIYCSDFPGTLKWLIAYF